MACAEAQADSGQKIKAELMMQFGPRYLIMLTRRDQLMSSPFHNLVRLPKLELATF